MTDETKKPEADMLKEMEATMAAFVKKVLDKAPEHVKALGGILRRSVPGKSIVSGMSALRRFCIKYAPEIRKAQLPIFRDYLICNRIDTKDLEPAARERLRRHYISLLRDKDIAKMTPDYRAGAVSGADMRCRDCKFFVRAPNDDDKDPSNPDPTKSCVALGTKGADVACYGYTLSN